MSHTIEWVNGNGKRKWQPVTADGKRQWLEEVTDMSGYPTYFVPVWAHPRNASELRPRLYRSRLRAARVARRCDRRKAANTWNEA